jgi:tRNA modification GTPase
MVVNKCDLPPAGDYGSLPPGVRRQAVSALTGRAGELEWRWPKSSWPTGRLRWRPAGHNPRHGEAFRRELAHVKDGPPAAARALPADLTAIDVAAAVDALGEVTARPAGEDVLERIFANFCIASR